MADKYATIQQHPNMRTPSDWQQMKSFVVQLEEILDDIYRRFGRLRFEDLGTKLQNRLEDDEGNISSIEQTAENISLTVGKKARTFYQNTAPASSSDYTLVAGDLWVDTAHSNKLHRYSGSAWVAAEYSDPDKYTVQSGIDITAAGIDVTGSKYVKIRSGGTFDVDATNFKIDSTSREIKAGNWKFYETGLYMNNPSATNGKIETAFIHAIADDPLAGSGKLRFFAQPYGVTGFGFEIDGQHINQYSGQAGRKACLGSALNKWGAVYADNVYNDSSRDVKHNIEDMPSMGDRLDKLNPVTFVYNDDIKGRTRHGLIYEDAVEVMPEICTDDEDGKAINYVELVPMLLKEIQSLRKRVAELEAKVNV